MASPCRLEPCLLLLLLDVSFDAERAERVQVIVYVQNQIIKLHCKFRAFASKSNQLPRGYVQIGARNEEVEIRDFRLKSKFMVIGIGETVIAGNYDNAIIIEDQVNMVANVISMKFASRIHDEIFV